MMRILVFVGLLALPIVFSGLCDDKDILTKGSTMTLQDAEPPEKMKKCFITSSWGKKYELFPNNVSPGSYDGNGKHCSIKAKDIQMNYAGVWMMETVTENRSFYKNFTVKMKERAITRPADYISTIAGQWITVWLDSDRDDLTFCSVTVPQKGIHNLMEDKVENITRIHGCGVRFLVKPEMKGQWTFCAQFGDYLIRKALFEIVIPKERKDNRIIHESWEVGRPATVNLYELGVIFCQLTKPDGVKLPLLFKSCFYDIPTVTTHHSGIWKASYATDDKMELTYVDINVTTNTDANFLESSLISGVGGDVNLLCKIGVQSMKLCVFVRPDKHVINAVAGLGNDRYSYYGQGYKKDNSPDRRYSECGLTIHNLSKEDIGLWTCEMTINKTTHSAIINVVDSETSNQIINVDSPKVYVKRGDDFKIRCSTNTALSYCWLTSPNGTTYSVSSTGGTGKSLKYDGKGFATGECGAIVSGSDDTDNGEWICHLGIENDNEVEGIVAVNVTDTYLIASRDTVYPEFGQKLSCRTFPDADETLRYCRWIRPNGHGINKEDASRYVLNKGISECTLTILTLVPEDIGSWQCRASTTRDSSIEEWAIIELKVMHAGMRMTTIMAIILGCGLLIGGLIGTFCVARNHCKKREYKSDNKIFYGIETTFGPAIQFKKPLH